MYVYEGSASILMLCIYVQYVDMYMHTCMYICVTLCIGREREKVQHWCTVIAHYLFVVTWSVTGEVQCHMVTL